MDESDDHDYGGERQYEHDKAMVASAIAALNSGEFDWVAEAFIRWKLQLGGDPHELDWFTDFRFDSAILRADPPPALIIPLVLRSIDLCASDQQAVDLYGWMIVELLQDRVASSTRMLTRELETTSQGCAVRDYALLKAPDLWGA